jgi:hypothetical protein
MIMPYRVDMERLTQRCDEDIGNLKMIQDDTRPYDTLKQQRHVALATSVFVYPCYSELRLFLS